QAEFEGLEPRVQDTFLFDMQRSGAGITWDWFSRGALRPSFINFCEDRDLWREPRRYEDTDAFMDAVASYPYDFDIYGDLARRGEVDPGSVIQEGWTIGRY